MAEFNDRRPGGGLHYFEPQPYFPHRGSPEKRHQGTQGKLFRDPKPADADRYQRGYTPERMRDIRDVEAYGGLDIEAPGAKNPEQRVAQAREHIARGTTPTHHLTNVKININDKGGRGAAGTYTSLDPSLGRSGRVDMYQHLSGDNPRQKEEYTGRFLHHELGHHRSSLMGMEHSEYRTPSQVGQEEAFADDSMMERFRPDPRDVRRGASVDVPRLPYETPGIFGRSSSAKTAQRQYLKSRQTPLQSQIRAKASQSRANNGLQPSMLKLDNTPSELAEPAQPKDLGSKLHPAFVRGDEAWQPFRGGDNRRPDPSYSLSPEQFQRASAWEGR